VVGNDGDGECNDEGFEDEDWVLCQYTEHDFCVISLSAPFGYIPPQDGQILVSTQEF
jgi:hypothetical protein